MKWIRDAFPILLQLAGIALVSLGIGLVNRDAGIAVGGVGLIGFGVAAELGVRPRH